MKLPAGEITLRLDVREDGTKSDHLFLTPRPEQTPLALDEKLVK